MKYFSICLDEEYRQVRKGVKVRLRELAPRPDVGTRNLAFAFAFFDMFVHRVHTVLC